jgi:hypothetical protein
MKWGLLNFEYAEPGILKVSLNTKQLFRSETKEFKRRLYDFKNLDGQKSDIYKEEDGLLIYKTEIIIPTEKKGGRISLLFLLGNPASHSVKEKMFFSYERDRKEHRFWKVLDNSGIFPFKPRVENLKKRNEERKEKLFRVDYDSPFCIGLATFYSMPSPATGRWAGVAGIRRLLRKNAFDRVTKWEKERIEDLIKKFVSPNGLVIAFQKDAFSQIRASDKPRYSLRSAIAGDLKDKCQCSPEIDIYCFPPTRLMYSSSRHLEALVSKYTKED